MVVNRVYWISFDVVVFCTIYRKIKGFNCFSVCLLQHGKKV